MGSGRSVSNKKATSPQEIVNYLDDLFAYALSIGMTYEQYWYQDPMLIKAYIKAEEYKQVRRNQDLWLQGLYVHIAIGDLVPILNPFSKQHKAKKYLEKPIPTTQKELELQEEARVNHIYNKLNAIANANKNKS